MDAKTVKKLEVIADMLAEAGKPGKVLDGWTLVPSRKAKGNPGLAEVYPEIERLIDDSGVKFVLARQKGEESLITKLFAQDMPDDNAEKVFADAEKKGAKDTTGEKKPAGK